MVGVADIPCVGKFVERISDKTVDAVFRGFRYMFCYKALVDQLTAETAKLDIEKEEMSIKVKKEKDNGKEIKEYVLKWQKDVEEIEKSGEELSHSCSCIQRLPIPNPVSRFRIGRNAEKKATTVRELTATGKDHNTKEIAYPLPVINKPKPDTAFEEFESRKDVYKKLWDALVNEDSPLIHGIYGMAGVGKTRMMEQLWEDAMEKDIFANVVRVNVGNENLNEYELQDQIAARLDCKLESQDVESRASQLENSLRNGGKILLILDDVWREIPLGHIIGTLFKDGSVSNGSKILLTSRQKGVCEVNNCEHPVEVKTLRPDEALDLFMKTVGPDTIHSLPDQSLLVKKVCDECGKLPLLILAVGKALKRKRQNSWVYALNQLQKGKFENIPGVDRRVHAGIKLSIDFLEHDAKSCLFLCCLFPEDAIIDMKMLIQLATGSQLIDDGESSVLAMVDSLKESSLLLDSGRYHETKVHDIIRGVARDVAFRDPEYAFLQERCKSKYLPSKQNYCTRKFLRLDAEIDDVHFDEDLECRDLHTLWLQCNNHPQRFLGGFFRMFGNLRLLMLQNVNISLKKFSLEPLGNLRTLILLKCDIKNTDVSLFPKKLETLCIRGCELPRPMDVANLDNLQKLEIGAGSKLVMKSNVISSLSRLEELHVPNGFIIDLEKYEINPIVMEISELTRLKSLQFHFYDDHTFQGRNVFPNIDRYKVSVGVQGKVHHWEHYWELDGRVPSTKSIAFYGNHSQSWEGLMVRAEEVRLGNSDVEVSRAFEHLERLYISECHKMVHLATFSHSLQQGATCFSKLTILKIENCSELKYLFCNKIAKSLARLQELMVSDCESMEAIIMNEGTTDGEIIIFPELKSLKIRNLEKLASFNAEKKNMDPAVSTLLGDNFAENQPFFDGKAAFPCLEKLAIYGLSDTSVIWGKDCFNNDNVSSFCKLAYVELRQCHKLEIAIPQAMLHRLSNLEYVDVRACGSLRTMFPSSVARDLTHLKKLKVWFCEEMREIIEARESAITHNGLLFPRMTDLDLCGLPSLTSFWCYQSGKANICTVPLILPQLSSISLVHLPQLTRLFHGANFELHAPALKQEQVKVSRCPLLEHIFEAVRVDQTSDMSAKLLIYYNLSGYLSMRIRMFRRIIRENRRSRASGK